MGNSTLEIPIAESEYFDLVGKAVSRRLELKLPLLTKRTSVAIYLRVECKQGTLFPSVSTGMEWPSVGEAAREAAFKVASHNR